MTDVDCDVAIAGGGVAGSSLAVLLGRAGLSVVLVEQHRFPREKTCAEGLMPAGVAVLERMGLGAALTGARFGGVRYHGWGLRIEAAFPPRAEMAAFGLGQRRLHLDAALFEAARATPGVTARESVRVDGPLMDNGRVTGLLTEGQPLRARLVVAADGPRSMVRRRVGLDGRPRARPRLGLRAHFRLAPGVPAGDLVEVFVGPGHEIYATPLPDGEISVAALTTPDALPGRPAAAFRTLTEQHQALAAKLDGAAQVSDLAGQLPLESRARRGLHPGLVLLGDAAGFVDPVTGGGMAQALQSAELLANVLAPHGRATFDPSYDRLLSYDNVRRRLLRDSTLLARMVLALARRPWLARQTLRLMAAAPSLYRHLVGVAGGTRRLLPGVA